MDNLESVIHEFFKEYAGLNDFRNGALVITRRDGIPLYTYKGYETDWSNATVAALVSGLWQAAETLTGFIPGSEDEIFRFSYDTSSRGIYIIELCGDFEPLYLAFIYFDLDNPAKMKSRVRSIEGMLVDYIEERVEFNKDSKADFLFSDISDDEMDDLFAGALAE
jgi:hypothetical protein